MDPIMELALLQRRFPDVSVDSCGKLIKGKWKCRSYGLPIVGSYLGWCFLLINAHTHSIHTLYIQMCSVPEISTHTLMKGGFLWQRRLYSSYLPSKL